MAVEIERRFIVVGDDWRGLAPGVQYRQGYLSVEKERTVRVRVVGDQAWLTLKSNISNVSRHEFEYPVPLADAQTIMGAMCPMVVDKLRHRIEHGGFIWEVDEFFGDNAGLVLAEIELPDESTPFDKPAWIGEEVTEDGRYTNAYLSKTPYSRW
ncbi:MULTISPECIES: CYTH domain-containing protein [Chromobacterium]|uniref:CYTH domain-containing protein n=2 Tax=Chromobacterium TaxID=535 RepID=A0ABS3GGE8_9NEIS|nr:MULTISPECIES: CYTH domain-containing protein [Chromobacterium]AXT48625.1 CYTH domain-containing protein [Chromobacterium rhizoryzae]MBK0413021.1 CYTH domain-containing protein [Chromobacterium haemolyticum]MBO0414123.1 CYTH domain-containing protein [Chromobacterium haemolyticum]MBO0497383.1 CYTH domain-containing protein [Chromobacterium haemolyticum]MDH0343579.1 CYTH domain-containing protein [Chromobacterium haemolyticum]